MKRIFALAPLFLCVTAFGQDTIQRTLDYDPEKLKIIPDKVFEIGIPFLIIFLLLNSVVTILRNRAEHQLKLKMIEKGVTEETLIKIFEESNAILKLQPMRWFLFTAALALAFLVIHLCREYFVARSGYLPVSIILFFTSAAFFIYYTLLQRKA
jgi:hypothetical protein